MAVEINRESQAPTVFADQWNNGKLLAKTCLATFAGMICIFYLNIISNVRMHMDMKMEKKIKKWTKIMILEKYCA